MALFIKVKLLYLLGVIVWEVISITSVRSVVSVLCMSNFLNYHPIGHSGLLLKKGLGKVIMTGMEVEVYAFRGVGKVLMIC